MRKWIGLMIYPFFVFTGWSANGQSTLRSAYQEVLNLNFSGTEVSALPNDSGIPHFDLYIENLREVTYLLFTEDEAAFDSLRKNEKKRLRVLRNDEQDSPYIDFLKAEIKIQWAFTKLKFGENWNGVWALRSAYKTIRRNIEEYPEFELNYKSQGLLHVIFGAVPDGYRWTLSLLGLEGDTQRGLNELYNIMDTDSPLKAEIRLISALVESYLIEDHEAALSLMATNDMDNSQAANYVKTLILMKSHQSAKAAEVLEQSIEALGTSQATPLFLYLLAEAHFQKGDYPTAKKHYQSFLIGFKGNNYTKDAIFKWGLCEKFTGNEPLAEALFEKARDRDADSEADKNAKKLLRTDPFPDSFLLQIRYAIDGGFYQQAEDLFETIEIDQYAPYEQFELVYRKARLRHLQSDFEEASQLYQQVIAKSDEIPETYFVPNSYLQLGYLEMQRGNDQLAIGYFEKVLTFKRHAYKNSLDSKAKIALKGLQKSSD